MAHFLGPCLVSWATKKQHSIAMSTAEAEYVAAASRYAQLLWIRQQLTEEGVRRKRFKTLAGRLDLPHVRKRLAVRAKALGTNTRSKQPNPNRSRGEKEAF